VNLNRAMNALNTKRWRMVYTAVVVFTVLVIAFLYLFSRFFTG
jgi:dolichyl-phosphate-mannose--protein O-mannosyl transferase